MRRSIWLFGSAAIVGAVLFAAACGAGQWLLSPFRRSSQPAASQAGLSTAGSFSPRAARRIIRAAISAYGGTRTWRTIEGIEMETVRKTYEGPRVIEDPSLVQLATTAQPQIRIEYRKTDQVFSVGDRGPWAMMRGKVDENPSVVARARFIASSMQFFLSIPFDLDSRDIVIRGLETKSWGGRIFDAVTIGFRGGSYPWPGDVMTLWFQRPNSLLDRCFWTATGEGSEFGPPPNHIWITWEKHAPVDGVPLARVWSFYQAESDGTMKEKKFDLEITNAVGNRSFLPVLFRQPIIEPRVRRLPSVGGEKPTPPAPIIQRL